MTKTLQLSAPQLSRALTFLALISCGLICCSPSRCFASSFEDRVSGGKLTDFTLVYRVSRYHKLEGQTRQQIALQVNKHFDVLDNEYKLENRPPAPRHYRQDAIAMVMNEFRSGPQGDQFLVTISERGNKLVVEKYFPKNNGLDTFVYDGQRSMVTSRGFGAQIYSGFKYEALRDFIFPGVSVCAIPLIRQMSLQDGTQNIYQGMVAMNDGTSGSDGLPAYYKGQIKTQTTDDVENITEMHGGVAGSYEQQCEYSNYHKIGNNVSFPAEIQVTESYEPEKVLPFDQYYTLKYHLQKASIQALPASAFTFEGHLPKTTTVQDNTKKESTGIRYVPGNTLAQQFDDAEKQAFRAQLSQRAKNGKRSNSGALGLLAVIAALCAWYFYRRTVSSRDANH